MIMEEKKKGKEESFFIKEEVRGSCPTEPPSSKISPLAVLFIIIWILVIVLAVYFSAKG